MNFEEYNILGNIVDDTYKSRDKAGTFKIVAKISGEDKLTVTCMAVVNILNRQHMQEEAKKSYQELDSACNEFLKATKKEFKLTAGRTLKTKEEGKDYSAELLNMSPYSPKGTALVRGVYNFEIK